MNSRLSGLPGIHVFLAALVVAAVALDRSSSAMPRDPCPGPVSAPAFVTVQTPGPEQFVVRVVDQALLDQMIDICNGDAPPKIVLGALAPGGLGYNRDTLNDSDWSWHLDPDTISLADFAIEVCDGLPSFVEANLDYWLNFVMVYCPWSSPIVAVAPDDRLPGDLNCDNAVDLADVDRFVTALLDEAAFLEAFPDCDPALADVNTDNVTNGEDIKTFVNMLAGV